MVTDTIMATANIATTIDRFKDSRDKSPTLPNKTIEDAEDRIKALVLFTAIAAGTSIVAYK